MATTTITGTINGVNNTALANKWITFRLVQLGTDSAATATVAQSVDSVQTDANGDFSVGVWNNGDSGKPSVLEVTIDGSKAESVIIPTGVATIELWDLIENYQADGSTSEQVPLVSSLFVRKSNNLSDLGSATTSRTNLGVAIGSNVQAHSAVLDATTASFTVAEESKLSGIEALAEVNDPTTLLDADINFTVQAHSAILDLTTASFTTAKDTATSTNTANIATNDTDIATNVTNIATNVTNIALKSPIDNPTFTGTINTSATGIDFDPGTVGGELSWNNTEKTLDLATGSDSVTLQLGQEVVLYVRNTTGATLSDGQVVTISGSQGNKPTVALAQADTVENARKTIGVVTQTILNSSDGFVTLIGKVRGLVLDDGTYTEGDVVYLSSTVAGGITVVEPDIAVEIGHVLATSTGGNTSGVLEVQVHNGAAIHELEQVVVANTAAIALNTAKVTNATHTGDVTGATALTIGANKVTLANMATMATASLLGRNTAATGNVEVLSKATALTLLNVADGATANSADATLLARANHTGTQAASTISDFDTEVGNNTTVAANTAKVSYTDSAAVALNSAKITNATHTGDVTGDTALTISVDAVDIPMLSATGTADVTTFLRGDNTWSIPVTGNTTVEYPYTTDFQSGVSQTRDLSVLTTASGYQSNANLTSLYIGSKITEIGFDSVQNSANLLDVTIPNSVTIIGDSSLGGCTGLLKIVIPNSVLDIQSYAFAACTSLASATIGSGVTQIRDEAFKDCTALASVSSLNPVAPTLTITPGSGVFFNILATTIDVPVGATGYGTTYGGLTVNYVL